MKKEKTIDNWEKVFDAKMMAFDIPEGFTRPEKIKDFIRNLLSLQKQEIVEEIEKELIKVLKVSKTADDYHIGIAYVIDTFLTP